MSSQMAEAIRELTQEKGYTKEQYYVGTVIGLNYSIPYFNGLFYQEIF